jgi:hypothetical protein
MSGRQASRVGVIVLAVLVATSVIVLWGLGTAGEYFGARFWDLRFEETQRPRTGRRASSGGGTLPWNEDVTITRR